MENCYKILSILITVYYCFAGNDDTLTPRKTGSDTGPEVREEIVRRLNEEVKENKDTSDFELPPEMCQPLDLNIPSEALGMDRKGHSVRSDTENFFGFVMTRKEMQYFALHA